MIPAQVSENDKNAFNEIICRGIQTMQFDIFTAHNLSLTCKKYNEALISFVKSFTEEKFDELTLELASHARQYDEKTDEKEKFFHERMFKNLFYIDPLKRRRICVEKIATPFSLKHAINIYSGTSSNVDLMLCTANNMFFTDKDSLITQMLLFSPEGQAALIEAKNLIQNHQSAIHKLTSGNLLWYLASYDTGKRLKMVISYLQLDIKTLYQENCLLAILNTAIDHENTEFIQTLIRPNESDMKKIRELFLKNSSSNSVERTQKNLISRYKVLMQLCLVNSQVIEETVEFLITDNDITMIISLLQQNRVMLTDKAMTLDMCTKQCNSEQKQSIAKRFIPWTLLNELLEAANPNNNIQEINNSEQIISGILSLICITSFAAEKHIKYMTKKHPLEKIISQFSNTQHDLTLMVSLAFCATKYQEATTQSNTVLCDVYFKLFTALSNFHKNDAIPTEIDKFLEYCHNNNNSSLYTAPSKETPDISKSSPDIQISDSVLPISIFSQNSNIQIMIAAGLLSTIIFYFCLPYVKTVLIPYFVNTFLSKQHCFLFNN